jgi:HlyD family secretion protein
LLWIKAPTLSVVSLLRGNEGVSTDMNEPVAVRSISPSPVVSGTVNPAALARKRRGRRGGLRIFVVLLLVCAGAAGAWWLSRSADALTYKTATVDRGAIIRSVSATGTVNPVLTVTVGSYVSGVIKEVVCDYNTEVKQGQVCARIDPRPFQTLLDQAKANLDVAKAQL